MDCPRQPADACPLASASANAISPVTVMNEFSELVVGLNSVKEMRRKFNTRKLPPPERVAESGNGQRVHGGFLGSLGSGESTIANGDYPTCADHAWTCYLMTLGTM